MLSIRISSDDLAALKSNADKAGLSDSEYVTACCLGKQMIVIDDLKEIIRQLKAIGNNLNQLTTLAHMGRVQTVYLDRCTSELAQISKRLQAVQERKRW